MKVIENDADALDVSDQEQGGKPSQDTDKGEKSGKGKEPKTVTLSEDEHKSLTRRLSELENSERYWSERARTQQQPQQTDQEEEEDEDGEELEGDDPSKVVDDFSVSGVQALVKRGVLTRKAARELIEKYATKVARRIVKAERAEVTRESAIFTEFPELRDQNSDLWKATSAEMGRLVKIDPGAANNPTALYSAAAIAKAKLDAKQPQRRSSRDDDDDRYEYDEDRDRRLRADSQGADRRPRGRTDFEDEADEFTSEAREVMQKMGMDAKTFRKGQELTGQTRRGRR